MRRMLKSGVVGLRRASIGFAVLAAVTAGAALAADPTDRSFGTDGIAEIEARIPATGQVGGIADLEPAGGGKMLAAVESMAAGSHYFAAARILPDGRVDRAFGREGFTARFQFGRESEVAAGGVLQSEAVAAQKGGKVLLAGYREVRSAVAPALARFTSRGKLDRSFGQGGKVTPPPVYEGNRVSEGGERLHDVAVEPDGTIVAVGDVVAEAGGAVGRGPRRAAGLVIAYRPDGKVDRAFGHRGRVRIPVPHSGAYTGFTEVEALPSGKLLVSGYLRQQLVLYRLTAAGRIDRSFGDGGRVILGAPSVHELFGHGGGLEAPFAVDRRGRIVLAGQVFSKSGFQSPVVLIRLEPDGRRDAGFGRSVFMEKAPIDYKEPIPRKHVENYAFAPQSIAIDGHGRIVIVSTELAPLTPGKGETPYRYFAARRFRLDGRLDRSFGHGGVWDTNPPGAQSIGRAALTQPDGRVVAGGWIQLDREGGKGGGSTAMLLTRYR